VATSSRNGTFENDRPPVFGAVGRDSGEVFARQSFRSRDVHSSPLSSKPVIPDAVIMSDEWRAYDRLGETGRGHATVNHLIHEWARDDERRRSA